MTTPRPFTLMEFLLKYWSGLLGLGGVGVAVIVFLATLSPRLSAAEKENRLQNEAILELKKTGEVWQKIYERQETQQMQQVPNQPAPRGLREWSEDDQQMWCCDLLDRDACYRDSRWFRCE